MVVVNQWLWRRVAFRIKEIADTCIGSLQLTDSCKDEQWDLPGKKKRVLIKPFTLLTNCAHPPFKKSVCRGESKPGLFIRRVNWWCFFTGTPLQRLNIREKGLVNVTENLEQVCKKGTKDARTIFFFFLFAFELQIWFHKVTMNPKTRGVVLTFMSSPLMCSCFVAAPRSKRIVKPQSQASGS